MRLIADIDHLDKEKVEKVISRIDREGVDTVLTYKTEENGKYKVEIIYKVLPDHTRHVPFFLLLTDKGSGRSNTDGLPDDHTFVIKDVLENETHTFTHYPPYTA